MVVDRRQAAVGVVLLLVAGGAAGVLLGLGPLGGNADNDVQIPTPTGSTDGSSGGSSDNESRTSGAEQPPFEMVIESIESCGRTCREVTATLVNQQEHRATDVTVYTRIYAGDDTEGDVVWEGSQDVGTLAAGASETDTRTVDLGLMEAAAVQQHDGRITILLVVETDRQTVRFVRHRDVI